MTTLTDIVAKIEELKLASFNCGAYCERWGMLGHDGTFRDVDGQALADDEASKRDELVAMIAAAILNEGGVI